MGIGLWGGLGVGWGMGVSKVWAGVWCRLGVGWGVGVG